MIGGGLYSVGVRVTSWENKLEEFDKKLSDRWTYSMERESWIEVQRLNPGFIIPNSSAIRSEHASGGKTVLRTHESAAIIDDCWPPVN